MLFIIPASVIDSELDGVGFYGFTPDEIGYLDLLSGNSSLDPEGHISSSPEEREERAQMRHSFRSIGLINPGAFATRTVNDKGRKVLEACKRLRDAT